MNELHLFNLLRLVRPSIRQAFAFDAFKRNFCACHIIDSELGAGIATEVEFRQIPIKVLLVHMLVGSDKAALEDREEVFEGVRMHVPACPLVLGMIH